MNNKDIILVFSGIILILLFIFVYFFQPKYYKHLRGAYAGNSAASFFEFEKQIGKTLDIHAVFVGWEDPFPTNLQGFPENNSQILLIFWEPHNITLNEITSGKYDAYIRDFASQSKIYGKQIILAPFHEMNGNWNAWSGMSPPNQPADFVPAWKHTKDVFENAPNVKWGWAVNNESLPNVPQNQIENYYPGDDYVDYVGVDGFNFGDPWQTYDEIFSPTLKKLKTYNKPVYIFSMASAEGSKKVEWIKNAFKKINTDPDIAGWVWFNENKEKNWLVNSDPKSLETFKKAIR